MSRLRASLSVAPIDREVQGHLANAEVHVRRALEVLIRQAKEHPPAHRSRVRRDIERCLGALRSVRRVHPGWDLDDPDMRMGEPIEEPVEEPVDEPEIEEEAD